MSLQSYFTSATVSDAPASKETELMYGDALVEKLGLESFEDLTVTAELDIVSADSALSEAHTLAVSLESIQEYLSSAKDNGGLTSKEANYVISQATAMTSNYEGLLAVDALPSMESFDAEGGALSSTELAMEGIAESYKKVMKTISAVVEAASKAAIKFYDQHISLAGRVGKAATALKTAVATSMKEDAAPKEAKVKFGSDYLFADGKEVKTSVVVKQISDFTKGGNGLLKAMLAYGKALESADASKLAETNVAIKDARAALDVELKKVFALSSDATDAERKDYGIGKSFSVIKKSDVLAGNMSLAVGFPAEGSNLTPSFTFAKLSEKAVKAAPEEMDALDAKGIAQVAADCEAIIAEEVKLVAEGRKLAEVGKTILAAAKKASKAVNAIETGGEQATDFMDAIRDVKELATLVRRPYIDLAKWATQVANANLKYGKASLSNLKKPEAPAA